MPAVSFLLRTTEADTRGLHIWCSLGREQPPTRAENEAGMFFRISKISFEGSYRGLGRSQRGRCRGCGLLRRSLPGQAPIAAPELSVGQN